MADVSTNPITGVMIGIVKRSTALTAAQKYLWLDLCSYWRAGCYKSCAIQGVDLGLSESAVDKTRRLLQGAGLARAESRQVPGRRGPGRPGSTWFAAWPPSLGPLPARRPSSDEVARWAARLDDLVDAAESGMRDQEENPDHRPEIRIHRERRSGPRIPDSRPETFPDARPEITGPFAGGAPLRGGGVRGGGAAISFQDVSPAISLPSEREKDSPNGECEIAETARARGSEKPDSGPVIPRAVVERLTAWETRMRSTP